MKAPLLNNVSGRGLDYMVAENLHETRCQEDDSVDYSDDPLVPALTVDAEFLRERQVGAVGASLVPSLGGSSDRAKAHRVPEHLRAMPFVVFLVRERRALCFLELRDHLEPVRLACHETGAAE